MAKSSFKANAENTGVMVQTDLPAPTESREIVASTSNFGSMIQGEVDSSDVKKPRLNIAQQVGDVGSKFGAGAIILNKEVKLSDGKTPIAVSILAIKKRYQQKLPFGGEERPKSFVTAAEVRNAGGSLDYEDSEARASFNFYEAAADMLILVPCIAGASDEDQQMFPYDSEGLSYALAVWTVIGTAYTSAAKVVFTDAAGHLQGNLHLGRWDLTTLERKSAALKWFVPMLKVVANASDAHLKFCQDIFAQVSK